MKNLVNRYSIFFSYTLLTWTTILLLTILAIIIRALFIFHYGKGLTIESSELLHCFSIGIRLDLKVAAYLLLPLYLLCTLATLFKLQSSWIFSTYRLLTVFLACLMLLIMIGGYYYYNAFATHFNEAMFGFTGQASAVIPSIWKDYPIIRSTLFILVTGIALWKILGWLYQKKITVKIKIPLYLKLISIFLTAGIYAIILRGSFSFFPLGVTDTEFSSTPLLNTAAYNSLLAFYDAFIIHKRYSSPGLVTLEEGLKSYNTYYGTRLSPEKFSIQTLFTKTQKKKFLTQYPPNVVFVQMESMGRHFLLFDNPGYNDLLGSLRPYVKKDLLFTNFLSGGNYTDATIARFLVSSPFAEVFTSDLNQTSYATATALPFKKKGYETVFLTSGQLGWDNLGVALKKQGFNSTLGEFDLLKLYPHAYDEGWGIADKYAFDYALFLLWRAYQQHHPIFIYINTVTNHNPYILPPHYEPTPINVPEGFSDRVQLSKSITWRMFTAYQYTNTMLGDFISQVEKTPFANKTIIAGSGDHNEHELKAHYSDPQEFGLRYGVFFFLHVPKSYLPLQPIDTNRIGSHKDIFPTLYNLSLSDASYPNFGNNLASPTLTSPFLFGFNAATITLSTGVIPLVARPLLYPWKDKDRIYVVGTPRELTATEKELLKRALAYDRLLYWQIVFQFQKNKTVK